MRDVIIGIDNGVSGSIGIILTEHNEYFFFKTPVFKTQDYTKKKKVISRLDRKAFKGIVGGYAFRDVKTFVERPFINGKMFNASLSAVRCFEAQINILEDLNISYEILDSKECQKPLLPQGVQGKDELKKASLDVGNRLFPLQKEIKHPDRDALLIAEYARRQNL